MIETIFIIVLAVILIGCLIFSATSYKRLLKAYNKFSHEFVYCQLNGLQFAQYAIYKLGLKIKISLIDGDLKDFYSPKYRVVVLSKKTATTSNVASISITAHELGHAVQHKNGYFLFKFSNFLAIATRIANFLFLPCLIAGIVLLFFPAEFNLGIILILASLGYFVLSYLLKIVNIPLEYNASKIAYNFLKENNVLSSSELRHAKKMLKVAAQTYVASLFSGAIIFFRRMNNIFRS
jgi:hypothetical protein